MDVRFAQIEPTTKCNFTCGFCVGRTMPQLSLPWESFSRFLNANPELEYVQLQGEGEPLMHPRIFDMVAACSARGIHVSIITNGSLLTPDNVNQLLAFDGAIESVHVSIESAEPDAFRDIRGGKLEKVVRGLRLLMRQRRENGRTSPSVGFTVTVLKRTLNAMDGIIALYNDLELDGGIVVQWLQTMPCYTGVYGETLVGEVVPDDIRSRHRHASDMALEAAKITRSPPIFFSKLLSNFDPANGVCPWLEKGTYLEASGAIAGCCMMKDPRHSLGPFDDVTTVRERRREIAKDLHEGLIPEPCAGCGFAERIADARREARHETILES